jgi:hypothetical protein
MHYIGMNINLYLLNKELIEDTQRFLRDLNALLIHIAVYLVFNISGTVFMFTDFSKYWWILFFMVFWSLLLIYHALQMAEKKNTTLRKLLLSLFATS